MAFDDDGLEARALQFACEAVERGLAFGMQLGTVEGEHRLGRVAHALALGHHDGLGRHHHHGRRGLLRRRHDHRHRRRRRRFSHGQVDGRCGGARRGGSAAAERKHQAHRHQVGVGAVAAGIAGAVALDFGAHQERGAEGVLQTDADLDVALPVTGVGAQRHDAARTLVLRAGARVLRTDTAERREVVGDRQRAHDVESDALDADLAVQRAHGRSGGDADAVLAQVEVAQLKAKVRVELTPQEHLVAGVAVVRADARDRGAGPDLRTRQAGLADVGACLAGAKAEVVVAVL